MIRLAPLPVLILLTLSSCTKGKDPLYCDENTPCTDPERPFCDINADYDPDDGLGRTCIPSPHDGACNAATPCTGDERPICTADDVCVECTELTHCPDESPVCAADNTCASCNEADDGDAVCAERDAGAPYCTDAGACVECEDSGQCLEAAEPVCGDGGTCRACEGHDECASGFCEPDGSCAAAASLIIVDGASGADTAGCGSAAGPCATIAHALGRVDVGRDRIVVRAGTYGEQLTVHGMTVSIVGIGEVTLSPDLGVDQFALSVTGDSAVVIGGLTVDPGLEDDEAGGNILCDRAGGSATSLVLERMKILDGSGVGVKADSCTLTITQSEISGNSGGGINIVDSSYAITNNFIIGNGSAVGSPSTFGGVRIENAGTETEQLLSFNTIAANAARSLDVSDTTGARVLTSTPGTCSNNIVYAGVGGQSVVSGNCNWTYSDIDGGADGTGNISSDPDFADPANDNYHLSTGSPAIDAADPAATVDTDFDGDARPQGGRADMGADEAE